MPATPIAINDTGPVLIQNGPSGSVNVIVNDTDADGNPTVPVNAPADSVSTWIPTRLT